MDSRCMKKKQIENESKNLTGLEWNNLKEGGKEGVLARVQT